MDEEKKNTNWKEVVAYIVVIIALLLIGFFIGRWTTPAKLKIDTKYIQLPPIRDTVLQPKPVYIKPPVDTANIIQSCVEKGLYAELFPYKEGKTDTIFTERDTAQILYDWASVRAYNETLFDIDTVGKCELTVTVQFNRLDTLSYVYTPIQKQTTITQEKVRVLSPFIGGGLSIGIDRDKKLTPGFDAQVGLFVKEKYGVSLQYQYLFGDIQNHVVSGQFLYKF